MDANVRDLLAQLRQSPLNFDTLDALRRACEATQDVRGWAEGLECHVLAVSETDGDPIELGRLHFELGNLYAEDLRDLDRALVHYRSAIEFDAAQRPAIAAARAILADRGEWAEASELLAREADSLPIGRKRAATYVELAGVYRTALEDREAAAGALREAIAAAPQDLQVQHELATLLLEDADLTSEARAAETKRREAADVLAAMARAVSDDYALAYVEAALNAVADHVPSLALLEELAPRMGRADVLAPRWLAAIAGTKDPATSRTFRLKMASAYVSVGQLADARICLAPLIADADPEAVELARALREADPESVSETLERAPARGDGAGRGEDEGEDEHVREHEHDGEHVHEQDGEHEDELLSSELLLEHEDDARPSNLARELAALDAQAAADEAGNPLADLAMLDRRDSRVPDAAGGDGERLDSSELSVATPDSGELLITELGRPRARPAEATHEPSRNDEELEISAESQLLDEGDAMFDDEDDDHAQSTRDEAARRAGQAHFDTARSPDDQVGDADPEPEELDEAQLEEGDDAPISASAQLDEDEDEDAQIAQALASLSDGGPDGGPDDAPAAGPAPSASETAPSSSAPKSAPQPHIELLQFHAPDEDDEADPFAEETQPRASPLTLAELTALTGHDEPNIVYAPASDGVRHDVEEVTQVTPAQDPQLAELRSLRTELAKKLRFRDRRGAAEIADILLERGVFDAEAIEVLEEHYRLTRDFARLRDLSMRIAREPSFSDTIRSSRLRESVMLSESKLSDPEGAAAALRELRILDPRDSEAYEKLKRLLRRAQRWDELATLIGQRVEQLAEPTAQAELLRELGALEREKRADAEAAMKAYARAHELSPEDADEVALSELYLAGGLPEQAARMYELRLLHAATGERSTLLGTLARLYESELGDDQRAQETIARWRAIEPRSLEALHAQLRVAERRGDHQALLDSLVDQLELVAPSERADIHERIAVTALTHLGDAARAADSFAGAIALAPQKRSLWRAAAPAFAQADRAGELDELLWDLAQGTRDRALQSELLAHIADTRLTRGDLQGAILAREAEYATSQDVGVLETVVALLRQADRAPELSRRLDELAKRSDAPRARALRLERAQVLAEKLRDPEAAKAELERLLSELGADDANALHMLVDLCLATGDTARRASAQERLIKLAPSLAARVELATALVDVYERELDDIAGAVRVLTNWTALEPENPQPYLRLLPLLAQSGKKRELIDALDRLTTLAITDEEAGEFRLRAARVAMEISDYDGAWNRLVPRVVEADDAAAEQLLRELAGTAGRGEQLAALYVGLAQRTDDRTREKQRWADAARAYEQYVGAHDRALEAMLRALAKQLDSEELLGEVERLAERAGAWARLAQVYDTIIRKADSTGARTRLLMRHARLLETRAHDTSAAFERVWLAFQLDPTQDRTYAESIRLSTVTGRSDELLGTYERRAHSNAERESRIDALLEACAIAAHRLEDIARATGYLSRAVMLAGDSVALLDTIEARVRALDEKQPAVNGRGLLAELAGVYVSVADEATRTPTLASNWLARAARLHEVLLDDPDAAFRTLERASLLSLSDTKLLDELHRVAALAGNWEGLAKHLLHASEVAIDSASSSEALSRLGVLCERELSSPSRAADAYEQLVRLRPRDANASRRLRHCLRAAERFDELLIAIDRELFMLKPEEGKRDLLKQAAEAWEVGLKNRYEALDAWKKVAAIAPADPDAVAALQRLRARPRVDDSLLSEEVVVLPEDLRPSPSSDSASSPLFGSATASSHEERARSDGFLADRVSDPREHELAEADAGDPPSLSGEFIAGEESTVQAEPFARGRDFDADLTLPLDRDKADAPISLDGLSSLVPAEPREELKAKRPTSAPPPLPPRTAGGTKERE